MNLRANSNDFIYPSFKQDLLNYKNNLYQIYELIKNNELKTEFFPYKHYVDFNDYTLSYTKHP